MIMDQRIETIKKAAKLGGERMLRGIPTDGVISKEGHANIVTSTDIATERIVISVIKEHFPDDAILGEEATSEKIENPLEQEHLWVIDPIDGTNNFRFDRNFSAVSIGYATYGQVQLGAIFNPYRNELFFAERGKGAFSNDKKIQVSEQKELGEACVETGDCYDTEGTRKNLTNVLQLPKTPWVLIRGSAVLAMADVACGKLDLFFNRGQRPWDNAAAFLLLEEAGGVVKNLDGTEPTILSPNTVTGNPVLVRSFLQAISNGKH